MRTFKIYSASDVQIHHAASLTTATLLHVASRDLLVLELQVCTFGPPWPIPPSPTPPLAPAKPISFAVSLVFIDSTRK